MVRERSEVARLGRVVISYHYFDIGNMDMKKHMFNVPFHVGGGRERIEVVRIGGNRYE